MSLEFILNQENYVLIHEFLLEWSKLEEVAIFWDYENVRVVA